MSKCGYIKSFIFFIIIFYAYCLVSMLWTPDRVQGAKELVYWLVHFVYLCEILVFAGYANKPLKSISWGWTLMIFLCSVVAGWELLTGEHLYMDADVHVWQTVATSTFGNRNTYVSVVCSSLPWIAYLMFKSFESGFIEKIILCFVVLMSVVVLIFNGSRGGFISTCIMVFVGSIVYGHVFIRRGFKSLVVMFFFGVVFYVLFNHVLAFFVAADARGGLLHDRDRMSIWGACLQILYSYWLVGCGIGGGGHLCKLINRFMVSILFPRLIVCLSKF